MVYGSLYQHRTTRLSRGMTTSNSGENMNTAAAHLTVVPDIDPADEMVALINAHAAAASKPRLVREPVRTRQERFDAEGLPRGLHCIERV